LIRLIALIVLILPSIADAAQCQGSDGKWYPYNHPACSGNPRSSATSAPSPWFQGGTLHKSTVAQWREASYANRLATAGDWLASTKWKGHLNKPADFQRLNGKAKVLVNAVAEASSADREGVMRTAEIAAAIITMSNDLGPY